MGKFNQMQNKSIQEIEAEVLSFWKGSNTFKKSVDNRSADNLYVFYDGPPFISGLPHYGHLLGSIAKDVVPRFQTMRGKRVERVWGWDAHGLTVENKVQKRLGIKNRKDIEKFGLEAFTQECYKYTSEISSEWQWYIDRIGRWVDMENAYKTIDRSYMESVIWCFSQLHSRGLIYSGVRTSLFCPICGTPVSNFEITMDNSYRDEVDPAVTIKFKIVTPGIFEGSFILAWTTTPWTLPSNRALVVDENETYVIVKHNGQKFVLAQKRQDAVFKDKNYSVEYEFSGKELIGLEYAPLYTFFASKTGEFKIYSFEGMVNMEDGTGVVHSAPGFGEIDTQMGTHFGLTVMMTLDDEGKFIEGNNAPNPYKGVFYLKTNDSIREDLKNRDLLFADEKISHRVPFHDRCDSLLVQKAQNSYFINVDKLKEDLVKNNEPINWIPDHLKYGRFKQGIEQAPDWCISRNRFWATPMPIWRAEDGEEIVISSINELEELSGKKVQDLHRPYIDQIEIVKDGKTFKRTPEVLDSWMEAGSMPFAQIHYPFENKDKFEKNFPGDYIVEYIPQVRAWFYVMHVISTALFGKNSFTNVVCTGIMAGTDGRKMSKTFGNYTDPKEVLEKIGGDALRLFLLSSPLMVGENANFDENELKTKLRNVLNPYLNSAKFFSIYASLHDFKCDSSKSLDTLSDYPLDKWILVRMEETTKKIIESMESYLIPQAVTALEGFVDDLSRWYVRRSRDRVSSGDIQALETFYFVLKKSAKVFAPIIPFLTEEIYRQLEGMVLSDAPESVHLCDYPGFNEGFITANKGLLVNMSQDREVVNQALSIRTKSNLPVRQPLQKLLTSLKVTHHDIVSDEVNVLEIEDSLGGDFMSGLESDTYCLDDSKNVALDLTVTPKLKLEREKREFVRKVQDLRKESGLLVSDRIEVTYPSSKELDDVVEAFQEELKKKLCTTKISPSEEFAVKKI